MVIRGKEGYFTMIKVFMHQEDTKIMSICAPHNSAPKIHDTKTDRIAKRIVINSDRDFNIPLTIMGRARRQKTNKDTEKLNTTD